MENKIKSLIKKLSKLGFSVKPKNKGHIDPVCGMEASGEIFASDYQGEHYYFCSEHCRQEFDKKPEAYSAK